MNESETQFRTVADTLPVLLWVAGPNRRCIFFNQRWLKFTGRTLKEELARGWLGSVHPMDVARCGSEYRSHFERREELQFEFRLRRADGEYRWMMASGAPEFRQGLSFPGYIIACTDVSDVRLARRQSLVHKKLETVGHLAAGIAHDFNNLLASIVADAEVLLANPQHRSQCITVQRIRSVAIRASEIVRELMVYAGRDEEEMAAVNLSLLVEEMADLLKSSITKNAKVTLDLAGDPPPVWAEAAELRQLVMNLILNASEAVRSNGGEIHLVTSPIVLTAAEPGATLAPGKYMQLEVSDTGNGMAPEVQTRLFEPYFTTKGSGRGMGLSVAQGIVRRYGGTIRCQSAVGRGSRFVVLLPCAEGKFDSPHATAVRVSYSGITSGATLLLVEDEEDLRTPVAILLRKEGIQVLEAGDGSVALDLLRNDAHRIDGILLDLTLPGIPSTQVIEAASRIRPDIKVLLTSAYSSREAGGALALPQVTGFIRKPYLFPELSAAIRQLLAGSCTSSILKSSG